MATRRRWSQLKAFRPLSAWDNDKGEFSNGKQVMQWVKPTFRKGWELKL
jgi:hypothetical protein